MNKNIAKYLQGISFSQLTFAYKTEIKNISPEIFAVLSPPNASHNPSRTLIIIKSREPPMISTAKLLLQTDYLTLMFTILFVECMTLYFKK
jgi:hypothetical protein